MMTFLMLLGAGFYQGQKTRWVRKHKPPGTLSAWGRWAGCWKIKPRSYGDELVFPAHTSPPHWLWDPSNQHPCCTPPAEPFLQPPGWASPQMGTGTLMQVATEHRQVVNAPRAPPRDHLDKIRWMETD